MSGSDPYALLGVSPGVDDAQLRAAYRHAVQLHHPDHNGGSVESARRFEAIQAAYAQVREQRAAGSSSARAGSSSARAGSSSGSSSPRAGSAGGRPSTTDPGLDARLAAMEQELAAARDAQERARRAAHEAADEAARATGDPRPSDEELGYVSTKDSFGAILSDAAAGLSDRGEPLNERVADLFEDLGARLRGDRPERRDR